MCLQLKPNPTAFTNWQRMYVPPGQVPAAPPGAKLLTNHIFKHVQVLCSPITGLPWQAMPCILLRCLAQEWDYLSVLGIRDLACEGHGPALQATNNTSPGLHGCSAPAFPVPLAGILWTPFSRGPGAFNQHYKLQQG